MNKAAVLGLFVLCTLPFLQRPWFFDDSSVRWTAEATVQHPLHPYDYRMDFGEPDQAVWPRGGLPGYTHPPLSAWLLGPLTRWPQEWPSHLLMISMALLALAAVFRIGERLDIDPVLTTALVAASPAFFLTSLTLYPHLFYLAFAAWVIAFMLELNDRPAWSTAFAQGVTLLLAALSLHSWPLLIAICVLWGFYRTGATNDGRWRKFAAALALFVLAYGGWCVWETHLYGMPHWIATWKVRAGQAWQAPWITRLLPLGFLTGSAPFIAVGWGVLARKSRVGFWSLIAFGIGIVLVLASARGGFSLFEALLLSALWVTALAFIAAIALRWRDASRTERFIAAWFLIEMAFVEKYLVFTSAHHLLLLLVPTALLSVRWIDEWEEARSWAMYAVMALAVFTLALAQADAGEAHAGPAVARAAVKGPAGNFFWGNCFSGYSYYLKRAGWAAYDPHRVPQPGDRIIVPHDLNTQGPCPLLQDAHYHPVAAYKIVQKDPLRTMSLSAGAGWYSASWGPLPFTASRRPVDYFTVYQFER
jgi:hypothetical protein